MRQIDNLYFEDGLVVHVHKNSDGLFFAESFCKSIDDRYRIAHCTIHEIEIGGRYNNHYWKTLKSMIEDIEDISKKRLIRKSYYEVEG